MEYPCTEHFKPLPIPKEEHRAILSVTDSKNYTIVAYDGVFFEQQIEAMGNVSRQHNDLGVVLDNDIKSGSYYFYDGVIKVYKDWETGIIDDWTISGKVRPTKTTLPEMAGMTLYRFTID